MFSETSNWSSACGRNAGWKKFIPTEKKSNYLNSLLNVGFDTHLIVEVLFLQQFSDGWML